MNGCRGTSAERGPYGVLGRTCPHAATGVELTPCPSVWGNRRPGPLADPDSAPTPGSRGSQVSAFQLPKWGDGGGRWRTPSRPRLQRPEALSPPSALEGRRSCCVTRVLLCFRWVTLHCELHVHFVPLPPGPRRRQAGRGARVFSRRVVTSFPPGHWSRSPSLHATIVVESLFWARLREGGARRPWLHRRVVPARGPGLRPEKLRFPLQSRLCPLPLPAAPDGL